MKLGLIIGALIGLAVATILIVHFGWRQVVDAALAVGWQGLAALIGIYLVCLLLCAAGWRLLILDAPRHAILICVWARWLRESIGNLALIPTAGEIAGARELSLHGVRSGMAGASTVVDLTLELLSQIVFTLFGLALLITWYRGLQIGPWLVSGIAISALAASGFILAQRKGLFRLLERLPETLDLKWAWTVLPDAEGIHAGIQTIYQHRNRVLSSGGLHLAGWVVGAGEAYVGLYFMGHAIAWSDALILESIAFALRTAAFVVPSRLGIQEGGYILLGAMFGLSPEVALGLSLLKRGREIATGLPCLIIWQSVESRRLWSKERRAKSPG
ncbi:MAG: lysylphosphatidylglycerol synthase domain-containing protein [Methyloceanibacter sp.]